MVFGSIDAVLYGIPIADAANAKSYEVSNCLTDFVVSSALSTTY